MTSPAEPLPLPPSLGGQAVVEGVMIRGPLGMAVCVRKPDGTLAVRTERVGAATGLRRIPVLRGVTALGETLTQGMRALVWSAQIAAGREPEEPSKRQVGFSAVMSLGFMSAFFLLVPAIATRRLEQRAHAENSRRAALAEGFARIGMLIGYLRTIGRVPQAQRLFAYHGAEHRAIQAYEAGEPLNVETLEHYPNAHVRCGTSFLLTTTVVSSALYAAIGPQSPGKRLLTRLALTPLIAGLSYEAIRLGSNARGPLAKVIFRPNLALQSLTTRDPDEGQMEVAIEAVRAALALHQAG
jgi:uncharacterized protein YqhQ